MTTSSKYVYGLGVESNKRSLHVMTGIEGGLEVQLLSFLTSALDGGE
jgi:hypothetical protein